MIGLKQINYMLQNGCHKDNINILIKNYGTHIKIPHISNDFLNKILYIFNVTCSNYRYNFENKTYIYNENICFEKWKIINLIK